MESYLDQLMGEIVKLDAQYQISIEGVIVILHPHAAWKIQKQRVLIGEGSPCFWEIDGFNMQIIRTNDLHQHQCIIISSRGVHKYNFKDESDKNTLP